MEAYFKKEYEYQENELKGFQKHLQELQKLVDANFSKMSMLRYNTYMGVQKNPLLSPDIWTQTGSDAWKKALSGLIGEFLQDCKPQRVHPRDTYLVLRDAYTLLLGNIAHVNTYKWKPHFIQRIPSPNGIWSEDITYLNHGA
jgi:hypothetical protein